MDGKRGERSLFSLLPRPEFAEDLLRTVLAQRHVDYIRSRRRWNRWMRRTGKRRAPPERLQHPPLHDPHAALSLLFSAACNIA